MDSCGLMWNFDKIQLRRSLLKPERCCGLMWNFDKIQRSSIFSPSVSGCGLMWNFDKIQHFLRMTKEYEVVV